MVRKQVALREDLVVLNKLAKLAKSKGLSVSDVIRMAIRRYLEQEKMAA